MRGITITLDEAGELNGFSVFGDTEADVETAKRALDKLLCAITRGSE